MKKEVRKYPLTDFVSSRKEPQKIPLKSVASNYEEHLEKISNNENSQTNNQEVLRELES